MRSPILLALVFLTGVSFAEEEGFVALFPKDGAPAGWSVQRWDDVAKPADPGVVWQVRDGVLHGSEPRGTWLVSDREYADFILEFEWKLGERGNSGCGLRFPLRGDPAFDGLELQMVDPRYYPADAQIPANELSGGLYRAVAPKVQGYRAGEWNRYRITCRGGVIEVMLNGELILNTQLDEQVNGVQRHDGSPASPLKDRPRRGRIGFQELSRGGAHVEIRGARILELK
jgi:hypothetical protein